jgi:hypothetical protein
MSHGSDNKDVKKKKKSWSSTCFPSQHTELHVRNRSLRWKCDALAVVTDFIALSLFVATFAACTQGVVFTHHCCRLMRSRRVALFCFTFFRLFEKKKKKTDRNMLLCQVQLHLFVSACGVQAGWHETHIHVFTKPLSLPPTPTLYLAHEV